MGFFSWILLGLIVGVLAKFIMPGRDPGGMIVTILIGILGAFLGGAISSFIGFGSFTGFDLRSIVIALAGAVLILFAYRQLVARRRPYIH